jgi:hypothetical protein
MEKGSLQNRRIRIKAEKEPNAQKPAKKRITVEDEAHTIVGHGERLESVLWEYRNLASSVDGRPGHVCCRIVYKPSGSSPSSPPPPDAPVLSYSSFCSSYSSFCSSFDVEDLDVVDVKKDDDSDDEDDEDDDNDDDNNSNDRIERRKRKEEQRQEQLEKAEKELQEKRRKQEDDFFQLATTYSLSRGDLRAATADFCWELDWCHVRERCTMIPLQRLAKQMRRRLRRLEIDGFQLRRHIVDNRKRGDHDLAILESSLRERICCSVFCLVLLWLVDTVACFATIYYKK